MGKKKASSSSSAQVADKNQYLKQNSPEKMKRTTRSSSRVICSSSAKEKKPISPKKSKTSHKKSKTVKEDKHKPKKPPTAFFYYLEDFRGGYQEQNPDVKSMRDVGKACGEKWKTMTYEEKVKYYDIATEKRKEFEQAMADYERRKERGEYQDDLEDSEYDEY